MSDDEEVEDLPPICERCDSEYMIDSDHERTTYCHGCAHIVAEKYDMAREPDAIEAAAVRAYAAHCGKSSQWHTAACDRDLWRRIARAALGVDKPAAGGEGG